jgi:NitT/TauT family transport system permease protein
MASNAQLDGPLALAALIWLSVLGILLFSLVALVERLMMPWERAGQH